MQDNKFSSLSVINGLEEISQENAAACSGGRITLYDGANQTGVAVSFVGGAVRNLSAFGFDNRASSIEITGNQRWRLWVDPNFSSNSREYGTGTANLFGIFNNSISSLSRVA